MERNPFFDNAKFILIFLVVFGHLIQPLISESQGIHTVYMWIYTFHMPAFIFLAGFFAKGSGNLSFMTKLARKLLVPYVIFQVLYTGYFFLIGKEGWQTGIFYPHWSLWFMFSLFSWHLLLIWFKKISPGVGLATSVGIGLIIGYFGDIGHTFSLSRTFVFFPFFLLGYWLTQKHVMWLKQIQLRVASVVVMAAVAVGIYMAPEFNTGWLLASKSYSSLGLPEYGILARFLVYITSAVMAASILAWIPKTQKRWTHLGTRTLYVYLLHGFFIQFFREIDSSVFARAADLPGIVLLTGVILVAALIVLLLSSRPIQLISQPFVEASMSKIKNRFTQQRPAPPRKRKTG